MPCRGPSDIWHTKYYKRVAAKLQQSPTAKCREVNAPSSRVRDPFKPQEQKMPSSHFKHIKKHLDLKFTFYVSAHDPDSSTNLLVFFFFGKIYSSLFSSFCCSLFIPYKQVDIAVYVAFLCLNWVGMQLARGLTAQLLLLCYCRGKKSKNWLFLSLFASLLWLSLSQW